MVYIYLFIYSLASTLSNTIISPNFTDEETEIQKQLSLNFTQECGFKPRKSSCRDFTLIQYRMLTCIGFLLLLWQIAHNTPSGWKEHKCTVFQSRRSEVLSGLWEWQRGTALFPKALGRTLCPPFPVSRGHLHLRVCSPSLHIWNLFPTRLLSSYLLWPNSPGSLLEGHLWLNWRHPGNPV